MPTRKPLSFSQSLSSRQLSQIQELLRHCVQDTEGVVLTEVSLSSRSTLEELGVEQFVLAASCPFSGLLWSRLDPSMPYISSGQGAERLHQINLTFDPQMIATFLDHLAEHIVPEQRPLYHHARSVLQENEAHRQSEFTLKLISLLATSPSSQIKLGSLASTPAPSTPDITEQRLQQQIEQERLLHQVATQIRQSLELPVILQTAVEQVRELLQVDRLVIYQLQDVVSVLSVEEEMSQLDGEENSKPEEKSGAVIYEARATDALPSVLTFSEAYCFINTVNLRNLSKRGVLIAVEDVEAHYANSCLLTFLQRASIRAKLVVPILIRNQAWGLLIAHQCKPRQWQENEQYFLQQIAEHLSIAISQAQLYLQVQQQKRTLEQRVAERMQELHDAMQSVQAANRAKSEFLAAVSHELRTPLTCIIGMSATLQRWSNDAFNERQRHFLQTIHDSGEHLLALINDILDLSQVESGKMMLNLSEFSLSRLVQQTLKAFEGQASLNQIELELDIRVPVQSDRFIADPRRVQQILHNLLDNAIKFTPAGKKVTLRLFVEESVAILQVKDQGIGIPNYQIPLLFQKFHQLNAGYHRQYRGTGLGLALTKQLIELHGGGIDVKSTVGVGSVFTVRLPMQQTHSKGSVLKTRTTSVPNPVKGRIVLIEPGEENANLICDVLTAAGYQVVWMLEGATAVDQIEVMQPIAIITNVNLPDFDGYNLIRCLRQSPITKNLKIIALTPTFLNQSQQDWNSVGADACLLQPIRPDLLLQTVVALTNA